MATPSTLTRTPPGTAQGPCPLEVKRTGIFTAHSSATCSRFKSVGYTTLPGTWVNLTHTAIQRWFYMPSEREAYPNSLALQLWALHPEGAIPGVSLTPAEYADVLRQVHQRPNFMRGEDGWLQAVYDVPQHMMVPRAAIPHHAFFPTPPSTASHTPSPPTIPPAEALAMPTEGWFEDLI